MFYKIIFLFFLLMSFVSSCITQQVDVLIVGGGASGTAAGIQSARMGVKTKILEETPWLGGMLTAAGVSAVDGNYKLPSGFFGEFKDSLIARYGGADALKTGWVSNVLFEPKTGNDILKTIASGEKALDVNFNAKFLSISKINNGWCVNYLQDGKAHKIRTKKLIDATELGDVARACGVKYDIGMEARAVCGEDIAPEAANDVIQDLTYVMILKDYGVDKTIAKPTGYDPTLFYCSAKSPNCTNPKPGQTVWSADQMIRYGKLPNGKYMINWPIEGNDYYVNMLEMNAQEREKALADAKNFSLCYLYYMQTELGFKTFGLDDEQFPTSDHFPLIPYHRESRRIQGKVRFNVNHVAKPFAQTEALYRTGIAVGDYPIDHHHKRYPEWEKLPELHFYPVPSYNVPLGALVPQKVENLIVAEKSISVSNLLNGSTRLQPVVLQIGQAAGALAAIAVKQKTDIADVPVRDVQDALLNAGAYLMPYLDLKKNDKHFKAVQRIGSTGILKGEGKNVGWSNETWFYVDSTVLVQTLIKDLKEFEPALDLKISEKYLSTEASFSLINQLSLYFNKQEISGDDFISKWQTQGLENYQKSRLITRKELAVLLDYFIRPFYIRNVSLSGKFENKN